jgi:hypothetical protein
MTIYFTASIAGKKYYLSDYEKITNHLHKKGFQVISNHILKTSQSQIRLETEEERLKFHKQLDDWINSSLCIVAETSFPSISVGYEISLALNRKKPVLILYKNNYPPSLLAQYKEDYLVCEKYNDNNLIEIMNDFLNFVQDNKDSRFNFYIPTKIATYLSEISQKKRIPKSVYIRQLIEHDMKSKLKGK